MSQNRSRYVDRNKHRQTGRETADFIRNVRSKNDSMVMLAYNSHTNTTSNYGPWFKCLQDDMLTKYPIFAFGNAEMSEKVTADPVYGTSRRDNEVIVSKWKELLRSNNIYNIKLRETKTSVFQEILNRLGPASRTRIESEPEYLGDCHVAADVDNKYRPFNLLKLIRNTHIAFTGSNFVNPDVARAGFTERLHNMTQGNDSLLDYMKRLLELREEELVFAENNQMPSMRIELTTFCLQGKRSTN